MGPAVVVPVAVTAWSMIAVNKVARIISLECSNENYSAAYL